MDLVAVALNEVGIKESPAAPNKGPDIEEYLRATTYPDPVGGAPYCSAFIAWAVQRWIQAAPVCKALGLADARAAEAWRYRSAAAFDLKPWAQAKGLQILPAAALARAGDVVVYQFSHCGLVIADEEAGVPALTVEANTVRPEDVGNQRDGNGVWVRERPQNLIAYYVRLLPA